MNNNQRKKKDDFEIFLGKKPNRCSNQKVFKSHLKKFRNH